MSWHYSSAGQQMGPVEEVKLQELFRDGAINADTPIWRAGMDGWKPYNVVFLGAQPAAQYAGFWIRVVASLIDGIILSVVGAFIKVPLALAMGGTMMPFDGGFPFGGPDFDNPARWMAFAGLVGTSWMVSVLLNGAYYTYFVAMKGATPGKMALGLKVVRADAQPISLGLALGRWVASWVSAVTLCIGFIIAAFDGQKRTLHDHICDTRVIRVRS